MLVIGHRGAAGEAAENTISSLQAAARSQADMVEADLRRTKDGRIVLMHDPSLQRTHDDRRLVSQTDYAELLKIGEREGRPIPDLDQFLQACARLGLPVNLELKETGLEAGVLEAVKNFPYRVLISSHLPTVLQKVRTLDEKAPLGLVIGQRAGYLFGLMLALSRRLRLESIHPIHNLITPSRMLAMRRAGWKIYPWTVNNPHDLQLMKGFGVDGVFTDFPATIKQSI